MESNSRTRSQEIIETLEKTIVVLKSCENPTTNMYVSYFESILKKMNRPHDLYKIAEELMKLFGGMGTFNDLILCRGMKILDKEQEELDKLSDHLYELVNSIVVEQRGGYIMQHPDGDYFISFEMADKIKNGEKIPEEILRKLNGEVE